MHYLRPIPHLGQRKNYDNLVHHALSSLDHLLGLVQIHEVGSHDLQRRLDERNCGAWVEIPSPLSSLSCSADPALRSLENSNVCRLLLGGELGLPLSGLQQGPGLKGSIGERPNHSKFSDESSVNIVSEFRKFC